MGKVRRKVKMFGEVKLCEVEEFGTASPEKIYEGSRVYWIERGEEEYGRPHFESKDGSRVVVYRNDWLRGKPQ